VSADKVSVAVCSVVVVVCWQIKFLLLCVFCCCCVSADKVSGDD